MKKEVKTLEQLRDSRIMFEKTLPPFGFFFIFIVLFALVGLIMWASASKKPYMIISQGTITNSESCYVMSTYTGEIEKSYMEEGKVVKKGDILFTIKSTEYSLQVEQLKKIKKYIRHKLKN